MIPPEEHIEPEIERKLIVERIDFLDFRTFKGGITEEELGKFDKRFHPLVIVDSKTVQALEHLWEKVVKFNRQVRFREADEIRQNKARRFAVTHWVEIVVSAGVGAAISYIVGVLFK